MIDVEIRRIAAYKPRKRTPRRYSRLSALLILAFTTFEMFVTPSAHAQITPADQGAEIQQLRSMVLDLKARVDELEKEKASSASNSSSSSSSGSNAAPTGNAVLPSGSQPTSSSPSTSSAVVAGQATDDRTILDYLRGTTINFALDTYYGYNFNHPVGRVNTLRAYDVLSNNISISQADAIFERAPDVQGGRPYGVRVDLQFGQATDTLQGNPANEPRPQIYRNLFQAYGTYVLPVGGGLTLDVGKWGSSIGIEGNYTKDQMNYSRSFYFDYLPFYHTGLRANYKLNDKLAVNYWLVNGTNQTEATNGFKDELFGFVATPNKNVSWTVNYYLGQDNPDRTPVAPYSPIPVQPGLSFVPITPAPDGRIHIFDSYVTWQSTPKLTVALEGDYVIQRLWEFAAPGHSAKPSEVWGGAAYARYQLNSKLAAAVRAEYLDDRGGLFSGITQSLKENTFTLEYKLGEGLLTRAEYRRDFSNRPTFFTDTLGRLKKEQNTATLGLVWWAGRKEGPW